MSLSFVKQAFKKLSDLSVNETVDIEGVKFSIGPISRPEEIKSQELADASSGFTYALRLEPAILSYAIRGIGVTDADTGECEIEAIPDVVFDPETGKTIERSIFLRSMLDDLPSPIIDVFINKYHTARNKLRDKLGLQPMLSIEKLLDDTVDSTEIEQSLPAQDVLDNQLDALAYAEQNKPAE